MVVILSCCVMFYVVWCCVKCSVTTSEGARKKGKYSQTYRSEWEQSSNLNVWLMKIKKGDTFAYCKSCDIDINIASVGKTGL